jgi:hypothetical protein
MSGSRNRTPKAASPEFLPRQNSETTHLGPLLARTHDTIHGVDSADELDDVRSIKRSNHAWVHVDDADALAAFHAGRGVFDVTAHGVKLEAFIKEHGLQEVVARKADGSLPSGNLLLNNRLVYVAYER